MDHLHVLGARRLLRASCAFFFGLLIAVLSIPAMADYPPTNYYRVQGCGPQGSTPTSACQSFLNGSTNCIITTANYWSYLSNTDTVCTGKTPTNSPNTWSIGISSRTCPYGGSLQLVGGVYSCTGTPVCPSGQEYNATTNACAVPDCAAGQVRNTITNVCQPPCAASGTAGGSNYVSPYTSLPPTICRDGCSLTVGGGFTIPSSTGTWYGVNGLVHTGEFCTGATDGGSGEVPSYDESGDIPPATVTPQEDPPRCKSGQCPGEVNGVYVCVSCSEVATETKPVTTYDKTIDTTTTGTPPNQTTTSTTSQTKATHDGSGTVTSSTTSSTTTTSPDGSGGTTTSTETATQEKKESQESFCKENPTSAFCKEGRWSGSCESDFQCEGDAVQCATARASWSAYCLDAKYETTEAGNLANAIIGGNDPGAGDNPLNPENVEEIDIASSAAIGPRQLTDTCIPNQTFSVAGASFTFDTGKFCDLMSICGNILVALASIAAFRIVGSA